MAKPITNPSAQVKIQRREGYKVDSYYWVIINMETRDTMKGTTFYDKIKNARSHCFDKNWEIVEINWFTGAR